MAAFRAARAWFILAVALSVSRAAGAVQLDPHDPAQIERLLATFASTSDLSRFGESLRQLRDHGTATVPTLRRALQSTDPRRRWAALFLLESLGPFGSSAARDVITQFGADAPVLRSQAARALGAMGRSAIPVLREALASLDPLVRTTAREALSLAVRGELGAASSLPGTDGNGAVPLFDAARQGDVEVTATGQGGYDKLNVSVRNTTSRPQTVSLTGSFFAPSGDGGTSSQREAVARAPRRLSSAPSTSSFRLVGFGAEEASQGYSTTIVVPPYGRWEGPVDAFCLDPSRPGPRAQEPYRLVPTGLPREIAAILAEWAHHPEKPQREIQSVVWQAIGEYAITLPIPQVEDLRALLSVMRDRPDRAELILRASRLEYWGMEVVAEWWQQSRSSRQAAERVVDAWFRGLPPAPAQLQEIRAWARLPAIYETELMLVLKGGDPGQWISTLLPTVSQGGTAMRRPLGRLLIGWSQEGGQASEGALELMRRWIRSYSSDDRDMAEYVMARSHPGHWPGALLDPWLRSASDRERAARVMAVWRGESARPPADERLIRRPNQ